MSIICTNRVFRLEYNLRENVVEEDIVKKEEKAMFLHIGGDAGL